MNGMLSTLPDGTPVLLRPIRPDDKARLSDGLRHLSPASVHRRFLSPKTRFDARGAALPHRARRDRPRRARRRVPRRAGAAAARGRPLRAAAGDPPSAQVAIVVCDDWQQRGLGSLIASELADLARDGGIERFTATMASDNVPAHRLMRKLTDRLQLRREGAGVSAASLDLVA